MDEKTREQAGQCQTYHVHTVHKREVQESTKPGFFIQQSQNITT